ncbi:MAG: hypothetical protein IPM54_25830 [Polyangiaceae bacterium]|nr:hypothetical protein [Polyangiaceae bacterium]
MADLQWSNPRADVVHICDKPLDVPEGVNLWAWNSATGQLVTGDDPAELRWFAHRADVLFEYDPDAPRSSVSRMPPEYGLTCERPAASYPQWTFLPSSTVFFGPNQPCAEAARRADPHWLAVVPGSKPPSKKKDPPRLRVCVRPSWVKDDVGAWAVFNDVKEKRLTASAMKFAEEAAKADAIFVFDANAPPVSACWFTEDPTKLRCPGKRVPKTCTEEALSELLHFDKGVDAYTGHSMKCDGQTTSTSSPDGNGPPLNFVEVLARNLAIAGALASGDTSGSLKDPHGKRYGMLGGKSADGPDWLVLQAAAGTFAIIGIPFKSGKEFLATFRRALTEGKAATILDPKVLSKEIAEQLAHEPEKAAVNKVIDAWKLGDTKAVEKAVDALESFGKTMAPSLREAGVTLPYSRAKIFTRGWEGKFQAHHILEVDMGDKVFKLGKAIDDVPAIVLSDAEHKAVTKALEEARATILAGTGKKYPDKQQLWAIYQKVYAGKPAWLEAIDAYFQ